jgi:hypothetical protein
MIMTCASRCDIYQRPSLEEKVTLVEGFFRFIETCMNKVLAASSLHPAVKAGNVMYVR